jgi:peptidoglycan/LPS O-acetylase OafA/YrhL
MVNNTDDAYAYKPFIDGLRAVAILTVVAEHVGIPGFTGGFIGVDIFFVISGYLIINLILADIRSGRYSFFAFEARRVLRILPAFLLVMTVTLILGTTIFVLPDYKRFSETFFLATILQANHEFLSHQGYFEMAAFTQPMLHTWSLAVEEQFYLIAPLALFGLMTWTRRMSPLAARRAWIIVTISLAALTFASCIAFTVGTRNFSFYLMPTRGWEFILGGAAPFFVVMVQRWRRWAVELLAVAGFAAVAYAAYDFDTNTIFPSYRVAWPVLGATLIIVSGLADPRNAVARVLATRPMVTIGLVSYSWYLWHWPLLSFFRTTNFGKRDLPLELIVAGVAFLLAILTYWLVEVPVRKWRRTAALHPAPVVLAGLVTCLLVAFVGFGWATYAAPGFLPEVAGLDPILNGAGVFPPTTQRGVLLGDSHGDRLLGSLATHARQVGAAVKKIGTGGCPPLLNVSVLDHSGTRQQECDNNYRNLDLTGFEFLILEARWNNYLGLPPSDPFYPSFLLTSQNGREPSAPYTLLKDGLAATISTAKRAGVDRVLIIGPLPEFSAPSTYCLMRALRLGVNLCTISRHAVDERRAKTMQILHGIAARFPRVRLIDPIDIFCTSSECHPFSGQMLYFSDTNHLSPAGVEKVYRAFQKDFLWAMKGDDLVGAIQ